MRRLNGDTKNALEAQIARLFDGYTYEPAPQEKQGQNGYCFNYVLERDGTQYLLKTLHFARMTGELDVEQANNEIAVCREVQSAHVATLLSAEVTDDFALLLFPLLDGQTLGSKMAERIEEGNQFTEDEVKDIGVELLIAVSDIWRKKKIVHQDIKPENIFLTDNGLKLLDFGAARFRQSPFRGSARHNFAYASPEQILSAPPQTAETTRKVVDDRSDVFSVGLILYELIEGRHPYEGAYPAISIARGDKVPPISRDDISGELKEIVYSMLSFRGGQRPHVAFALASLQQGKLMAPEFDKGKFYYCATNGFGRFHELAESNAELFDGVVADAAQIPDSPAGLQQLRVNSSELIIDPQTYIFQKPAQETVRFKELPYYSYANSIPEGETFVSSLANDETRRKEFIADVINFQLSAGASALVPPFFYIEDFTDTAWTLDQLITEEALAYIKENALPHPVVKGVALQQGVLTSSSKESLIEYLTSLEDMSGFILLLDSAHSEVIIEEPWLRHAKELFTQLLATGKSVIWSRADVSGLVIAHPSLSLAMGESLSSRKFNIDAERGRGTQVPYIYLPGLFARVKWPDAMKALKSYSEYNQLVCEDACCAHANFDTLDERNIRDLAFHILCQFSAQFRVFSGTKGTSKAVAALEKARGHFDALRASDNVLIKAALRSDIKPSNSTFISNWLNTLHGR